MANDNTPQKLPDTPDWSPARRATIRQSLWYGMALVALPAFGALWNMSDAIALVLVNAGTTVVISSLGLHIGAASLERVGAWWLGRPVLPEPSPIQVMRADTVTQAAPVEPVPYAHNEQTIALDKANELSETRNTALDRANELSTNQNIKLDAIATDMEKK